MGDGANVFERFVQQSQVDLAKVAAHFAFSSLFKEYEDESRIFCYMISRGSYEKLSSEDVSLAMGNIAVVSEITGETCRLMFCVVRFGSHDFKGGISPLTDDGAYASMKEEIAATFEKGYYSDLTGLMENHFGTHEFSLTHLFRDERREILNLIITAAVEEFAQAYRGMYEHNRSLMEFIQENGMPVPKAFLKAAEPALNEALVQTLMEEQTDSAKVGKIVDQMKKWDVAPDSPNMEFLIRRHMEGLMVALCRNPSDLVLLNRLRQLMELLRSIPLKIVHWQIQNSYYGLVGTAWRGNLEKARSGDEAAAAWVDAFREFGEMLDFKAGVVLAEI